MRVHNRICFTALALAALACASGTVDPKADGPAAAAATSHEDSSDAVTLASETETEQPLTLGQPVTLRLAPSDELLAVIRQLRPEDPTPPSLRLTLLELARPQAEVTVRVFVNAPEVTLATPLDGPHYLGTVGFYPTTAAPSTPGGEAAPDASTFLLNLGPLLAALPPDQRLVDGRFIDVTLIAAPLRESLLPEDLGKVEIPFQGVRLSLSSPGSL